jgi:hypothetical protein
MLEGAIVSRGRTVFVWQDDRPGDVERDGRRGPEPCQPIIPAGSTGSRRSMLPADDLKRSTGSLVVPTRTLMPRSPRSSGRVTPARPRVSSGISSSRPSRDKQKHQTEFGCIEGRMTNNETSDSPEQVGAIPPAKDQVCGLSERRADRKNGGNRKLSSIRSVFSQVDTRSKALAVGQMSARPTRWIR